MNDNKKPSDFFRTSDIWLVAFLLAVGEHYVDIDRTVVHGRAKVFFLFHSEVESRAHEYFNGGMLPAVQYKNSVENVRSILFDM